MTSTNIKISTFLTSLSFLVFLVLFILQAVSTMHTTPFYEFDEAHRAENAKRMKEYGSFVPLTGSVFDRNVELKIPFRDNPLYNLYYHLERPPFVYWLMIALTSLLGQSEFAFRLPSLILGLLTILVFLIFAIKLSAQGIKLAFLVGGLALLTSSDLWLSSQYAQLDAGLTLFLFLSLLSLIYYCEKRKFIFLLVSAISFALAFLSKGQPTAIFIFPLAYLFFTKKLLFLDLFKFLSLSFLVLLPWLIAISLKFGFFTFLNSFIGFAIYEAKDDVIHHQAPFFWYTRWWWDTLRPGWSLFLAFLIYDIFQKKLDFKKKALLAYIGGSLLLFSLSFNKVWWYVLPLIPAIAFYLYLSVDQYLKQKNRIINTGLVIILASLPFFVEASNKITVIYGLVVTLISFLILNWQIVKIKLPIFLSLILPLVITASLLFFYLRFPKIIPFNWYTKDVAQYFTQLPGNKCLWVYNIPTEAALFYSGAGEVHFLTVQSPLFANCEHFLMTPTQISDQKLVFQKGDLKLYKIERK